MLDAFLRASAIRAVCGRLRVGFRGRARARLRARDRASVAVRVVTDYATGSVQPNLHNGQAT